MLFGLIGYPLVHSFSKKYFTEKFQKLHLDNYSYELFPIKNIGEFPALLADHPDLKGLNVTIPYKESVMGYLDDLDFSAEEVGAVNTIVISNGRTKGYNTDLFGFKESIRLLLTDDHQKALILGTGGSSRAVAVALSSLGIDYQFVSRDSGKGWGYSKLDKQIMEEYQVIINTTPLGMYPEVDSFPPIPYQYITPGHLLFDLVYNPGETEFLKKGKAMQAEVKNGLEMLYFQAEEAWEIWNEDD